MIVASQVTKSYGGFLALKGIDLSVGEGEVVSIVGPNGAGKSTLVNMLTGLASPTSGSVRFDGMDIGSVEPQILARKGLARSFQLVATFPTLTVFEMIALGLLSQQGRAFHAMSSYKADQTVRNRVEEIAAVLGLSGRLDVACSNLSQGEKKLADIASALALNPRLVLMDEPTSGVSSTDKHKIMGLLIKAAKAQGVKSIILVEHDMDLVLEYSTRVVALQSGKILADMGPKQFFEDPELLRTIVGRVEDHA